MTRTLALPTSSDDIVITIGGVPVSAVNPNRAAPASENMPAANDNRITIEDTQDGREIFDRDAASHSAHLYGLPARSPL